MVVLNICPILKYYCVALLPVIPDAPKCEEHELSQITRHGKAKNSVALCKV